MNKKILFAGILALSGLFAAPSFAQQSAQATVPASECTRSECPAFENLNLTPEQKAKLQDLCAKQKAQKEEKRKAAKEAGREAKRQKQENAVEARKQHLAEIKAILTPEQYTQFLENSFVNGKGMKCNRPDGAVREKVRDGHDKAMKNRGDRPQRDNKKRN